MPMPIVRRWPIRSEMRRQNGLIARRMPANADTTRPIRKFDTPNEAAKIGSTGIITPNPTATKNAATASITTVRGNGVRGVHLTRANLVDAPPAALRRATPGRPARQDPPQGCADLRRSSLSRRFWLGGFDKLNQRIAIDRRFLREGDRGQPTVTLIRCRPLAPSGKGAATWADCGVPRSSISRLSTVC